jgi:pyocin large subunit-like protein
MFSRLGLALALFASTAPALAAPSAATSGAAVSQPAASNARFASERKLQDHFRRHGRPLGCSTAQQYLRKARALVSGGPGIETHRRRDGDTLFYKAETNEFAVLSPTGIIRTYFAPDSGIKYWRRQLAKDK